MKKYDPKEHAWTGDFYNEKEWEEETKNPSGYLDEIINSAFPSLAQTTVPSLDQLQFLSE